MMKNGQGNKRSLVINHAGSSLLAIFQGGQSELKLSREAWLGLLPDSKLQPNCNRNGFNLRKDGNQQILLRLGIMGNNENDCRTPDSFMGVGIYKGYISGNGYSIWAMSYLFVK